MSEQQQGRDPLEEMREQLASVSAGDVIAEASLSLVALAYVRLGVPPEEHERYRDLDAARLRMTYVEVANLVQAGDAPAGEVPEQAPQPEGPGIYRPSGLWVPGGD